MYVVEGVFMRRESEQVASKYASNGLQAESWDERKWELRAFKNTCKNLCLEGVYNTYMLRLQRSYLSIFLVIQTFFGLLHTIILVGQATKTDASITVEVFAYLMAILIVWLSLFVTFREEQVKKRPWLPFAASCSALFILIVADLTVPLYHAISTFPQPPLRPGNACHILLSIYIFLPLMNNWHTMLLGLATTIAYLVELSMITYRLDEYRSLKVISEGLFLLGINLLGLFYRLTFEITIRRTLLDRRQCVEGNLVLKFQREQERNLLLSILPEHTADALEKDISHMIRRIRNERNNSNNENNKNTTIMAFWRGHEISSSYGSYYAETHDDVTILYSDVVNYTKMTTKLKVKPLVETLHELFVKFDQASEENEVLRIKFLGDCYYCVAGVPVKNANHAKSCVELGLRMIRDIQEVRQKRDLDINMRIGIHSGSIISGIIGACKWQYDIWSRDVVIANRMESTGEPGKLHITQQTLALLRGNYVFTEGTEKARRDPILQEHAIKTFLITPPPTSEVEDSTRRQSRMGSGVQRLLNRSTLTLPARTSELTSVKNFMRDSIEHFRQIMRQINVEMTRELNLMPIGKFHFNKIFSGSKGRRQTEIDLEKSQLTSLSMIFLCFKNRTDEWPFLNEPDHLLKYSILAGFVVYLLVFGIQTLNQPYGMKFSSATLIGGVLLLIFVPFAWFKKLWLILTPGGDEDERAVPVPKWAITRNIFRLSNWIPRNAVTRTMIYVISISLLTMLSFIHLTRVRETTLQIEGQEVREDISADLFPTKYINAWAVTHCLILTICMNFLFLKIHFMVKFSVGLLICIFYLWLVLSGASAIFTESSSTNVGLDAQVAHLMAIFFTFITIHLVDRQSEYISRIDYNWKKQLLRKQEEAELTKDTNNFLVHNILPAHVAEIYINQKQRDELYHEEFDDVAVMFATITNFNFQADALNILNGIICDFDERLLMKQRSVHIEKIKVAGWTYMAACGLQSKWGDSSSTLGGHPDFAVRVSNGRRIHAFGRESDNPTSKVKRKLTKLTDPVFVLTEFALELMEALRNFNEENFSTFNEGQLRIGISNGEIMAGVVGSSKPLYDIWGDAVNMASRMDSTGLPGRIQVTPNTAHRLQDLGVQCDCRGFREIKGAGQILTYFVGVDENLNLIPEQNNEQEVTEL